MPPHAKRDKPLVWLHGEIKTAPLSAAARVEAGVLLRRLQRGESIAMPHSRPMAVIGNACHELRVQDADRSWRIMYCVQSDAIGDPRRVRKNNDEDPEVRSESVQQTTAALPANLREAKA